MRSHPPGRDRRDLSFGALNDAKIAFGGRHVSFSTDSGGEADIPVSTRWANSGHPDPPVLIVHCRREFDCSQGLQAEIDLHGAEMGLTD
jgi:hypothetical protein